MIAPMNSDRPLFLRSLGVRCSRSPGPVRADFPLRASLRAEARAQGFRANLDAAFGGLQPDLKVLDFQEQPEFKTPSGTICEPGRRERVADGKAGMAQEAGALARPKRATGSSLCDRRDLGRRVGFRRRWASGRLCSRCGRWPALASGRIIFAAN